MAEFTHIWRVGLIVTALAGLTGCDEPQVVTPPPPPPSPTSFNVGGTVSGLSGSGLVLQLNGQHDLNVSGSGKFSFPIKLNKGTPYNVTVKSSPTTPIRQTCTASQNSGNIAAAAVNNIAVTCVTNTYAVGGKVIGVAGKGLGLELNGTYDVVIVKNGNFVFPDVRLPDGSDYSVAIKSTPRRQQCTIKPVNTAPDNDTINIVEVSCSKKARR